jgi:hypothetical protein
MLLRNSTPEDERAEKRNVSYDFHHFMVALISS